MDTYVKVSGIYKKLKEAEDNQKVLYISGAAGYGKSSAVEYFYRKKAHLNLNGLEGYLKERPKPEEINQKIIIVDDISWIVDVDSREYIEQLIRNRKQYGKHIILLGRSRLPSWLRLSALDESFLFAGEPDLECTRDEAKKLLDNYRIKMEEKDLDELMAESKGHPLCIRYTAYHMSNMGKNHYDESVRQEVRIDMFHYFDRVVYDRWNNEMRTVLLALCQYPSFTVEMAELVTGNTRIPILFEAASSVGTFFIKADDNTYSYRPMLRFFFQWKQSILWKKSQISENFERAALYYELHDSIEMALFYYQKAGKKDKISELLIRNAEKHPGTAHFFETREYYLALPEETIKEYCALMSGMSMLYSIMMQPESAEYWYQKLKEYEHHAKKGSAEQKEATIRIAYLDIALPGRGIHGIVKTIRDMAVLSQNKTVKLPEFSVTGNLPSLMNGGLDFCEWSRNDKQLALLLKKPIELALGKSGVGLINVALAESGFEKATMDDYEVMTRLNSGYLMAGTSGSIEICFAAAGLMVKDHLKNGQAAIAEEVFQSFQKKASEGKAKHLFKNMKAFHIWMELLQGMTKNVQEYLKDTPDERVAFCILDRYQYMIKIRCLIVQNRLGEALNLIEWMHVYFTSYERNYMWVENQILKSIILYRLEEKGWEDVLRGALKKAERYHLIRVFAQEGIALKPLLDKVKKSGIDNTYYKQIKESVGQMAVFYSSYLKMENVLKEPLTETEKRILKLLCGELTAHEISDLCSISYNSLKFHNKNIYKKLGVNSRGQAVAEAHRLGLDKV